MAVHEAIQHLEPNPILNTRPPEISKSVIHLPRPYRSNLTALPLPAMLQQLLQTQIIPAQN